MDVCNYLEKKYPNPPLWHEDDEQNNQDKLLIKEFETTILPLYYGGAMKRDQLTLEERLNAMKPHLLKFEKELEKRGTFFGGDSPKMMDYMIWPWTERAGVLEVFFQQKIDLSNEIPRIYKWCSAMRNVSGVKETFTSLDRLVKLAEMMLPGAKIDYESI